MVSAAPSELVRSRDPRRGARSRLRRRHLTGATAMPTLDVSKNPFWVIFLAISPLFSTRDFPKSRFFLTSSAWAESRALATAEFSPGSEVSLVDSGVVK